MWEILDWVLSVVHGIVVVFNLLGWIPSKTRRLHFALVNLTAFSWMVMGSVYGWGYCFLTDWHWRVKHHLGEQDLPSSFVQYVLGKWGMPHVQSTVDSVVAGTFAVVWLIAWIHWWRRRRRTTYA